VGWIPSRRLAQLGRHLQLVCSTSEALHCLRAEGPRHDAAGGAPLGTRNLNTPGQRILCARGRVVCDRLTRHKPPSDCPRPSGADLGSSHGQTVGSRQRRYIPADKTGWVADDFHSDSIPCPCFLAVSITSSRHRHPTALGTHIVLCTDDIVSHITTSLCFDSQRAP